MDHIDNYFKKRRSVRKFMDREVPDSIIDSIIERAMKAPTTGNMQLYTVVISREEDALEKLRPSHFNQPASMGAKALLTVCADFNRFSRWCEVSGAIPGYDNFLSFISAMLDATIFAQQIVTIAETEGLGTCYLGTVTYNADQISDILELPDMVVPIACIALGWPEEEGEATERLSLEAVRCFEKYPKFSDDEVKRLYVAKDDYPANAKYVKENHKESLAQVFTDIRYPKAMNEEFSMRFLELLKQKRFL